jgi:hypothetical protein
VDDVEYDDSQMLVDLQRRLGGTILEALRSNGTLSPVPLTPEIRTTAKELLSWKPERPYLAVVPTIQRVRPHELLSEGLPNALRHLGEGGKASTYANEADAHLASLAERAYCALLASNAEESMAPLQLRGTEEHRLADAALRSEPNLAALWTDGRIATTFCRASTDRDGLYSPVNLLIHSAWRLCLLRGDWTPSALLAAVLEQTNRLRKAACGEQVEVPIFLGFGDIMVTGEVSDGTASVRPCKSLPMSLLLAEEDRLRPPNGLLVERGHPWKYCVLSDGSNVSADFVDAFSDPVAFDELRHWGACFVVAIAMSGLPEWLKHHHLAQRPEKLLTTTPTFQWILNADPLLPSRSLHLHYRRRGPDCPKVVVDANALRRTEMLFAIKDAATRIAIERLCAALETSRSWGDSLIDAVIAWEALSGNCQGAVATMVSAVMAHLVSDAPDRKQVRAEIRKLYSMRSGVVHGGKAAVQSNMRDAANLVGLVALRRLADDDSGLIDSEDRFEQLCLDSH